MSTKAKRIRVKPCDNCSAKPGELFRIRHKNTENKWIFTCAVCRQRAEAAHPMTYRYGGTWKSQKRH